MRVPILALSACAVQALVCPVQAHAQSYANEQPADGIDIAAHVREASQRFGIPEHWIYAVIRIESAGRIRAVSSAGAMGLMQLMPGTWARQRARFSLGSDPFDPRDNIMAGTSYLREMYDRYGAQGFLAAYNAGPGRYEDWLAGRRLLPLETRRYVAKIAPWLQQERIFAASTLQPSGAPALAAQPMSAISPMTIEAGERGTIENQFVRSDQLAHDLFVPVSTVSDQ